MARITPRITPHIPSPRNLSPRNFLHSAPRAIATGNVPHPRISGLKLNLGGIKTAKPAIANLTKGTSTGRPAKANAKPSTPSQITQIKTNPRPIARLPRSATAMRPGGVRSIQGAKMKVRKVNPYKLPHII